MTVETAERSSVFELTDIKINYGFRCAVDGLSLSLSAGHSLGLLGPNGAGKTSTLRALLGMLRPRHGQVSLFGRRPGGPATFRRIGFAPEDGSPPEYVTALEYLLFVGAFRVRDRGERRREVMELLTWFDLAPGKRVRDFSKGMIRRLVLAAAFLGSPDLLVLDEPLNGLDPLMIIKLRERLEAYRKAGGSVLFSSHILAEVEKTCTDVAILSAGQLAYSATLETLLNEFPSVEQAFAAKVGAS